MKTRAASILLMLYVLLLLPHTSQSQGDEESRGLGQCAATEDLEPWSGTISIREKCFYDSRPRNWTIPFPINITNIDGEVRIQLTFVNFTLSTDDGNVKGPATCDHSDRVKISGILGAPPTMCRGKESSITLNYFIHKNAINSSLHIEYTHENSQNDQTFAIQYKYPDYPCFLCSVKQECRLSDCMSSDSHCTSLQDAYFCEDLDPCLETPCKNGGTCIRTGTDYKCTCPGGFTGLNCQTKVWCYGVTCENGGNCEESTMGKCVCPSNIWGERCQFENDGTYCSHGIDKYSQSRISWENTKMGNTDTQPCPYANGTATRQCLEINGKAQWAQPDLSLCVSPTFHAFSLDADKLVEAEEVTADALNNITSGIGEAVTNKNHKRLYAGDLTSASSTVNKLASLVQKVNPDIAKLGSITEGFGNAITSLIDPVTSDVWSFTQQGYLENQITSILSSLEELSKHVADKTSDINIEHSASETKENKIDLRTKNLEFTVHVLDRATNFSTFLESLQLGDDSLTLPTDVLETAMMKTSDPFIHLYKAKFTSLSQLLSETNALIKDLPKENLTEVINSDIISSKVLNVKEKEFSHLLKPVRLSFNLKDENLSQHLHQKCVFLNMSSTESTTRWLSDGCVRSDLESNATHTTCYCSHLTNFAVLMDIYDVSDTIDEFNSDILTYMSYGGGALSVLGCLISIIVFELFRLKTERVRIHEQFALTIIMVQVFFLVGINRTENKYVCMTMAICLHYFLVAMFSWMFVEGAHLYLVLVKVFKARSNFKKYLAVGWGVPFIIVGISASIFHDEYGSEKVCWLSTKVQLIAFVPPVGLVIVINTVVLIVVMRIMLNSLSKGSKTSSEERSSIRTGLKAASVLLPLLGLTWTFGFLSITNKETLVFTYLFTFFNSLQGVFFFVFHCLLSADVQNAYDRRLRRKSQMRLNESSLSKKSTLKRDSEFGSNMHLSSYSNSRNSLKTVSTDVSSTLDRKKSNRSEDFAPMQRPHSVAFEDDVFYDQRSNSPRRSLSNSSHGYYDSMNTVPEFQRQYDEADTRSDQNGYRGDHTLNNALRWPKQNGSVTSGEYVLYYGKQNTPNQDTGTLNDFDRNELYAKVRK